jgi:hypothetical protein
MQKEQTVGNLAETCQKPHESGAVDNLKFNLNRQIVIKIAK